MPALSPKRAAIPLLLNMGRPHRGKVADTYDLGDGLLLVVRTDAISIFDFVLNAMIPYKGEVLTAMSHYWFGRLWDNSNIKSHFVAAGGGVDRYLPMHLRRHPDLQARAMVVKKLKMMPVEFIARGYLTGSALKNYKTSGEVCGITLPHGLQDGDEIPDGPLLTPTTKAESGHDTDMSAEAVWRDYPREMQLTKKVYLQLAGLARQNGFLLADTKLEFGRDEDDVVVLADEVGTPDSSRYWSHSEWQAGRDELSRKAPSPFDKQFVREWGKGRGIDKLDPESADDTAYVHSLHVPEEVIDETAGLYRVAFLKITGHTLEQYEKNILHVG
jgi:phosphoribosylaminoimidazole-succinocarboxamide synthase